MKTDSWVIVIVLSFLIGHITTLLFGYFTNRLPFFISMVNLLVASIGIIYWGVKSLKIRYFNIETREVIVLIIEVIIMIFAIYFLVKKDEKLWVNMVNYIGFSLHFMAGIVFLIFMLTFKMNRLI
jgi:hypothetical protein